MSAAMGSYAYYRVRSRGLRDAMGWLEQVAASHGDGEPTLRPTDLTPAAAKALGLDLNVILIGKKRIEDAVAHFTRTSKLLRATPEAELRYTNKVARPDFEIWLGYFSGGTIVLEFTSTIFRKLDREVCRAAAVAFFESAAAKLGVKLSCTMTMSEPKVWPRESQLKVRSISGAKATIEMGTRLHLEMPRARQRFRSLLARSDTALTTLDLTVRGPHSIAAAEYKRLGGARKPEMIVDSGDCAVRWPALRELAGKTVRGELTVEVPLKVGELELRAALEIKRSKYQLELVRKWGLGDDELETVERALGRPLTFVTEV